MKDNSEKIYNLWPLYIGEFINYEHNKIKDDLIKFFNTYEKKFPEGNAQLNEIGNSALYFVSDMSSGITGEIHYVDCGYNIIGMPREL